MDNTAPTVEIKDVPETIWYFSALPVESRSPWRESDSWSRDRRSKQEYGQTVAKARDELEA